MTEARKPVAKATQKRTPRKTSTPAPASQEDLYIRNAGHVPVRIRAHRARNESYDYSLAPRGQRGDTAPIFEEDVNYLLNDRDNAGLFEVVSAELAHETISKQTRNQQRFHPAQAALRDEQGNPVTGITTQHEGGGEDVQAQIITPQSDGSMRHREIKIQR